MPQLVGQYRILDKLGEGGAGTVFLATPTVDKPFAQPGDLVALKVYNERVLREPKQKERINREFKVGATLRHPNVVTAYELGQDGAGRPFLVMEYVDGNPLSRWVEMYHPISNSLLLPTLCQILDGLIELHKLGLLHRDLKPSNVMFSEAFTAKIMDLGVVLPVKKDELRESDRMTPSDKFLGTIRNSAPEHLFGINCDQRADLYSFGTILFFLLHGEEVFAAEDQFARLVKKVETEQPAFDEALGTNDPVRGRLLELCKRLLAKKPEERPEGAETVREILRREQFSSSPSLQPIFAYMAAALTGLGLRDREGITFVGHAMAEACKELNIYAHQPRKATDPILHKEIPAEAVYLLDRRRIISSDLVIGICNETSFGVGQEFEIAAAYGVPTLLVKREGVSVSRMVLGSCLNMIDEPIEYTTPEDLKKRLVGTLKRHIDDLRQRRELVGRDHGAQLGQRLRALRDKCGWSMEQAARRYGVSPNAVRLIENNSDYFHNAGLVLISRIANVHNLSVVDLLGPTSPIPAAPQLEEDANISLIEQVACAEDWSARDLVHVIREYRGEALSAAARGASPRLTTEEIHKRHEALQRKRLEESRLF
jgi:transcriptional regulator with XRE-family HTH domain/tRNA A-37 threonylcarbamoyl transferase component Bud32